MGVLPSSYAGVKGYVEVYSTGRLCLIQLAERVGNISSDSLRLPWYPAANDCLLPDLSNVAAFEADVRMRSRLRVTAIPSAGLQLRVADTGVKSWHWRFYWHGKRARLVLGVWPKTSQAEAHEKAEAARVLLRPWHRPATRRNHRCATGEVGKACNRRTCGAVFDRGAEEFPNYLGLDRSMLRIEMPRWGGSYEMVDGIVNYVAYGARYRRDLEKYAQLYWIYDSLENDDINIFEDASDMKAGFILMIRHHPRSDVVINGFARFACLGGDSEQYKQLRPRLKEHYSATAWSAKISLEACDKKFGIAQATATGE